MLIGISIGTPKFFYEHTMKELAPRYDMLQMPEDAYRIEFAKILNRLNAFEVLKRIKTIANEKDVALLCYEKPNDFCHRHLVAEWLKKEAGFEVKEFGWKKPSEPPPVQQSLF